MSPLEQAKYKEFILDQVMFHRVGTILHLSGYEAPIVENGRKLRKVIGRHHPKQWMHVSENCLDEVDSGGGGLPLGYSFKLVKSSVTAGSSDHLVNAGLPPVA